MQCSGSGPRLRLIEISILKATGFVELQTSRRGPTGGASLPRQRGPTPRNRSAGACPNSGSNFSHLWSFRGVHHAGQAQVTRVIAWSGGPDSTLALKQALETNDPVVAVHVVAATESRYLCACRDATRRLEPELLRIRPFPVVRYWVHCEGGESETTDEVTALILCAALAYDDPVIYWGRCREDRQGCSWINRNSDLERRQQQMLKGLVKDKAANRNLPKSEVRRQLGPLWDLTWSCLYPTIDLLPCGQCGKCRERDHASIEREAAESDGGRAVA